MGHQMFGAHFVNTSQNKDNLLIDSKRIRKSSYKMQKNVICFFCTLILNSQKFTYSASFLFIYLFIYLFVLQLTSQNSACRKKCYFFLPFLIISFFFQTRKK